MAKNILGRYQELQQKTMRRYRENFESGQIVIQVGSATCELAAGADEVKREFEKLIQASGRQDILIKQTGCTGRCSREPIVGVFVPGYKPYKYEQVTPDKAVRIFQQHVLGGEAVSDMLLDKKTGRHYSHIVTFCSSPGCVLRTSKKWEDIFLGRLGLRGIKPDTIRVYNGGCIGLCGAGPGDTDSIKMMILPDKVTYGFKTEAELDRIIKTHFVEDKICEDLVVHLSPMFEHFLEVYGDVAFFNKQTRLTLRNSGLIDPESLDEYIYNHGYEALAQVLNQADPAAAIGEVTRSGLRGRGGAGFPTGLKWADAAQAKHDPVKYVVCNADEGDPGAFMDRSALEGDPFSIIEGMTIGAYAVGARQGYMYIRAEYPLAITRCQQAIEKAWAAGLLGENILGSGFDFDLEIRLGAGAFVCGEETALMRSIEGRRGQPRIRPPYPTQVGLWGHPTVINNVETWANIPVIFLYSADWFASIGTEKSKGTKVFALAGKINNTGLVEVPMGTTLRDIIYDIGGGLAPGRSLKAIQTGGPSGGCIPISAVDTPVDYDSLAQAGSIMGSGGMIVLDDEDCMVSTARFFLEFTQSESCGKCVPCREGTLRMLEILERIVSGRGEMADLEKLERLAILVKKSSLCGLGQSAPNPILSALKNFRAEFVVHVRDKKCPTHRCSKLITYEINPEKCVGCTLCARRCPADCIKGAPKQPHLIDNSHCIKCGECYTSCKFGAIKKL
jgi:NADH:ubiquinone oxidoreductase subunit F (NADH-binding)/(2Fe-2S) ferredoxin/NAD-dependent dihydropyrimidine dehydrogenase PreA subunit